MPTVPGAQRKRVRQTSLPMRVTRGNKAKQGKKRPQPRAMPPKRNARLRRGRFLRVWRSATVQAALGGEKLDLRGLSLNADVKAVTMHRFAVRKTGGGYEAEVVLDI